MEKSTNTFLDGPILPALLRFSIPVLCALLLQALYGAVDLWAVGTFCGEADVSAVATGSQTTAAFQRAQNSSPARCRLSWAYKFLRC